MAADSDRLVYSTQYGQLDKPVRSKGKKKSKPRASSVKSPAKQGVRIRREVKGRGGKTVCVIDGLILPESALKLLLKHLKGVLGTGGAIKNGALEIQGDHRDKLLRLLEQAGHKVKLAGG